MAPAAIELLKQLQQWIQDDLVRPVVIVVCAMLLYNLPTVIYKVRMFFRGILYLVMCWDKSWKLPQDPGSIFGPHLSQGLPVQRKTVYFVRHGESTWNDTFNKGSHRSWGSFLAGFFPGLVKAVLYEIYLLLSGKMDSWFYDAPLSHLGLSQVEELHTFVMKGSLEGAEAVHMKILRGDPDAPRSKILSSNLRRAISTLAGGFRDRLGRNSWDKIIVLDSLQEVSRNPDTLAITPARATVQASWIERSYKPCNFQSIFDTRTDTSLHTGDKPLDTNGLKRMNEFCEFVYFSPEMKDATHVVVGGHSLWFRYFFNMFLPYSVHHVSKNKKIVNGGIVTFELMKAETRRGPRYMIDPKTIRIVYGGF